MSAGDDIIAAALAALKHQIEAQPKPLHKRYRQSLFDASVERALAESEEQSEFEAWERGMRRAVGTEQQS